MRWKSKKSKQSVEISPWVLCVTKVKNTKAMQWFKDGDCSEVLKTTSVPLIKDEIKIKDGLTIDDYGILIYALDEKGDVISFSIVEPGDWLVAEDGAIKVYNEDKFSGRYNLI